MSPPGNCEDEHRAVEDPSAKILAAANELAKGGASNTIQAAVDALKNDPMFDLCRPIVRDLYNAPADQLRGEALEEYRKNANDMKCYSLYENEELDIPSPVRSFEEAFGDNLPLMEQIKKQGFAKPSPIQSQMWPLLLSGLDTVGVSQTGSGKTLAFLLPAFLHIDAQYRNYGPGEKKPCPSVLVLSPTRELAQQIQREVDKYSYNGYKSVCLYGGAPREEQAQKCNAGVEIVIATPGRLADFANQGKVNLSTVSYVVLDEADRMLDQGFEADIRKLMFDVRPDRLFCLTSATWPEQVRALATRYIKYEGVMCVIGSLDLASCSSVTQYVEFFQQRTEQELDDAKMKRLWEIIEFLEFQHGDLYKLIVFTKRKSTADDVASDLVRLNIRSEGLHGARSQEDRENALKRFREGGVKIMIATDLASRGLDVPDITHVINYDFPDDIEEYVHRVGRTGRAGRVGNALSFFTWRNKVHAGALYDILKKTGQNHEQTYATMQTLTRMKFEWENRVQRFGGGRGGGRGGFRRQRDNDGEDSFKCGF